jgi:hypothetical protein
VQQQQHCGFVVVFHATPDRALGRYGRHDLEPPAIAALAALFQRALDFLAQFVELAVLDHLIRDRRGGLRDGGFLFVRALDDLGQDVLKRALGRLPWL